jgi:hypothetical protein
MTKDDEIYGLEEIPEPWLIYSWWNDENPEELWLIRKRKK